MKKALIITGIIFVVIVGIMISIPLFFQDEIYEKAKKVANEAVDAKVEIGSVKLSLFRSFPKVYVELKELEITGVEKFENQMLLNIESVSTSVDLSSIWSGKGFTISGINIDKPTVNLVVNKEGKANWDIVKESAEKKKKTDSESEISINLEKLKIADATFKYTDEGTPSSFSFENGQMLISGKMHGSNSTLDIDGEVKNIYVDYKGANYVKDVTVSLKSALQSDFDNMSFSFLDNEILVNKLPLKAEGNFSMPDDYYFDLTFTSPESEFKELLGFIPAEYQSYLEGVQTEGNVSFDGFVKGKYDGKEYPALGINLTLQDGWLKYPELPGKIDNIEVIAKVSKPQGDIDLTIIDISRVKASVSNNPVAGMLRITTPVSDPKMVGNIDGKIDFSSLSEVIPMDSVEMKGMVEMELSFAGNYSDIENKQYSRIITDGTAVMENFEFVSDKLPEKVRVSNARMKLTPESIRISDLNGKMGRSDFSLSGALSNYWAYILTDKTLEGNLSFKSQLLDLNQLMHSTEKEKTKSKADTTESKVIEIPANIHLVTQASINKMIYDKMIINNTKGKVTIKDKKLILDDLNMDMLNGQIVMAGEYYTPNPETPEFNFRMNLRDFDIPSAYKSLSTVKNLIPVAGNSTGSFSSGFALKGQLAKDLTPVMQTLNGDGDFEGNNVEIIGAKVFSEISKYFVKGKFDKVAIDDFKTRFKIANGGMEVVPFKTKIAGQEATISGYQTVSKELNYKIDLMVNKNDLNSDVNKFMAFVPGTENIDKLPVGVIIEGTFDQPVVKVDMSEARKLVETEFKKKSSQEIQDAAKKIGNELKKLFK